MTDVVLLDTHIALWLDNGSERLHASTRALIDNCWQDGGVIYLSAITAWEIALLVDTGRISLDLPPLAWIERFLNRPGVEIAPLDHKAATSAYPLHPLAHRDPADRLLIATAISLACPLVTYDERITEFAVRHGGRYGFTIAT